MDVLLDIVLGHRIQVETIVPLGFPIRIGVLQSLSLQGFSGVADDTVE